MTKKLLSLFPVVFMLGAWQARADDLWFANRTIEPGETLQAGDVSSEAVTNASYDALRSGRSVAGMDARRRILAGRALLDRDVEPHRLVHANTSVSVIWQSGLIRMELQGRALQAGSAGDQIKVLNPSSSRTLVGTVMPDGTVQVGG